MSFRIFYSIYLYIQETKIFQRNIKKIKKRKNKMPNIETPLENLLKEGEKYYDIRNK